jgi:hypothetical protein
MSPRNDVERGPRAADARRAVALLAAAIACALPPAAVTAAALPDLAIKALKLDSQCRIVASVVNLGPGALPDAVWTLKTPSSSGVYLTINGKGWGGATIWSFDPGKSLQKLGGAADYVSTYVVQDGAVVQATVDQTQQVAEGNEGNNSLTANLACGTALLPKPGSEPPVSPVEGGGASTPPPAAPATPTGGANLLQSQLPPPPQNLPPPPPKDDKSVEPGELVVVSGDMAEAQAFAGRAQALGLGVKRRTSLPGLGFVVTVLRVPKEMTVGNALGALRQALPSVWADANHRFELHGDGAVLYARKLVGLDTPSPFCGGGLRIGLIDTGLDLDHPALKGRDIARRSFITTGITPAALDHGTAVAALLVGDTLSPGFGGLVPGARLHAAEVFRARDGKDVDTTAEWVVLALDWLAARKVRVINLSLGGPRNLLLEAAIERLRARDIAIVAAAGNKGPDAPPVYPAAQNGVIAVTAVDAELKPYKRANRGDYIAFAAPGVDLWTAAPGKNGGYVSGTSYAAPFVTAALAVARQTDARADWPALLRTLQAAAKDLGDKGKDAVFGWGLVQIGGCGAAAKRE